MRPVAWPAQPKSGTRSSLRHTNYCCVHICDWSRSLHLKIEDSCSFPPFRRTKVRIHHPKHTRPIIATFVSVVYRLSFVHKHCFVRRAIFVRINQGTHQGWMPQFRNSISIRNLKKYILLRWAKQHFLFPLFLIQISWIFILFFKGLLMLSFVLFLFFNIIILYFCSSSRKIIACLLKGKNWRENMYENQKQTKKNVEGIQNICLSCLL